MKYIKTFESFVNENQQKQERDLTGWYKTLKDIEEAVDELPVNTNTISVFNDFENYKEYEYTIGKEGISDFDKLKKEVKSKLKEITDDNKKEVDRSEIYDDSFRIDKYFLSKIEKIKNGVKTTEYRIDASTPGRRRHSENMHSVKNGPLD